MPTHTHAYTCIHAHGYGRQLMVLLRRRVYICPRNNNIDRRRDDIWLLFCFRALFSRRFALISARKLHPQSTGTRQITFWRQTTRGLAKRTPERTHASRSMTKTCWVNKCEKWPCAFSPTRTYHRVMVMVCYPRPGTCGIHKYITTSEL